MHASANADAHADDISAAVAPLAPHAPQIANSFQRTALRATAMLAGRIPPGHKPTPSITPQFDRAYSTQSDRAEFDRASHLTHDPVGYTFDRLDRGMLTKADVDAVRSLVPKTYEQMTTALRAKLTEIKKPLPYDRKLQFELLLGVPDAGSAVGQILEGAAAPPPSPSAVHGRGGAPVRQLKGMSNIVSLPGSKVMG